MTKVWHIMFWIAVALLVAGAALAGVGLLSGASTARIAHEAFGENGLLSVVDAVSAQLLLLLEGFGSVFGL